MCRSGLLIVALLAALSSALAAQGSAADFDRAERYAREIRELAPLIRFRANWMDADSFWFESWSSSGARFLTVDAQAARRDKSRRSPEPAFDHEKLANALSRALKRELKADALPIKHLNRRNGTWSFMLGGGRCFSWEPEKAALAEESWQDCRALQVELTRDRPRSSNGGPPLPFVFVNTCDFEVDYFWIPERGRAAIYGSIAPGAATKLSTFAGHVWEIRSKDGRVLGRSTVEATGGILRIEDPGESKEGEDEETWDGVSPDGRYRAFLNGYDLRIEDLQTREIHYITRDGHTPNSYEGPLLWSPDSTRLFFRKVENDDNPQIHFVESSPSDQLQPKLHARRYLKPGDRIARPRLYLLECPEMTVKAVDETWTPNPWSFSRYHWRPDSSALHVLYNERGHQLMRLLRLDRDGELTVLIEEKSPTFIDYAGKLELRYLDDRNEILWASEREGLNRLYIHDADTGKVIRELNSGPSIFRRIVELEAGNPEMLIEVLGLEPGEDPYQRHLLRVSLDSGVGMMLTGGDGDHEVAFSPGGEFLIDSFERPDLPPRHVLRHAALGDKIMELPTTDLDALRRAGFQPPERFVAPGRDGETPIYGLIWRPTNFDPAKRYPVIESIYAGPHGQHVPKNFRLFHEEQKLAELGFIVVKCDGMGTNWRVKAFHDVCWKNLGDSGFPDRIAWMKAAAAREPAMDLERVGIYGVSAGGQSALRALLAHGDFYKVAVSDCGCHDNRMDKIWWNELWMGWPLGPHYEEQSNVTQAHRLEGKLLLMVGELDDNVDPASTMQVVSALIKADKDFDLLVFPGLQHGTAGSPYGERRRADFFVRYLWNREPRSQP